MTNKILIIAPTPFFSHRGCHIRIYEMIKRIEGKYTPIILTYPLGKDIEGMKILRTPKIFHRIKNLRIGPSFGRIIYDVMMAIEGMRILRRYNVQFILSFLHEGIIIGKILSFIYQKRLLSDIQGSLAGEISEHTRIKEGGFLFSLLGFIEQFILSLPDKIIINAKYLAGRIKRKRRIYVVPDFPPSQVKISTSSESAIIFVGILKPYQGIEYLLEMMKYLNRKEKIRLYIIGYPDVKKYKMECDNMGIGEDVEFLGKISYFKIGNYLKNGMVAVSPKLSQWEGNGKLLLYLAYHLPIVVFNLPINREILQDAGVYIPPENAEIMAEEVVHLLKDKQLYEKYQALSQKRYSELIKETNELIKNIFR